MNNSGKTCLIADANEKLGKAVGLYLAKQGAKLVLCFDRKDRIDSNLIKELDDLKATYKVAVCDFLSYESAQQLVDELKNDENFKDLNAMYYNVTPEVVRCEVNQMSRETLTDLIDNYILKAFCATKIIGDYMQDRNGVIIYRGSVNDDKPTGIAGFNSMYYAVIKNLNREAAIYYGYYHLRTVCLELGAIDSEDKDYHNDISTFYDGYEYKVPSGYIATTDDFGSLISYLISDECRYINGAEIRVDGGLLFQYIEAVMTIATHKRLQREGKE